MKFAPEYVTHVLNEVFEDAKTLLLTPLTAINYAHLVMLAAFAALIVLTTALGLPPANADMFRWAELPGQALLIHAWGTTPTVQWNFPSWSISAEWFAYLFFPLAAAVSIRLRRRPLVLVGLSFVVFGALFLATQARGLLLTDMTAQGGLARIVPAFLMGAALHRLGLSTHIARRWAMTGAFCTAIISTSVPVTRRWR